MARCGYPLKEAKGDVKGADFNIMLDEKSGIELSLVVGDPDFNNQPTWFLMLPNRAPFDADAAGARGGQNGTKIDAMTALVLYRAFKHGDAGDTILVVDDGKPEEA